MFQNKIFALVVSTNIFFSQKVVNDDNLLDITFARLQVLKTSRASAERNGFEEQAWTKQISSNNKLSKPKTHIPFYNFHNDVPTLITLKIRP